MKLLLPYVAGLVVWSLIEYGVHRWVGHTPGRSVIRIRHMAHHVRPLSKWWDPVAPDMALYALMLTVVAFFWGGWIGCMVGGLVSGYVAYEAVHWQAHHGGEGYLARRHRCHHQCNPANYFGVSSPLLDWMLRTNG